MTSREKEAERIAILQTISGFSGRFSRRPSGVEIADMATPPISRRGIGQKLSAMVYDGLLVGVREVKFAPLFYEATRKGHEIARSAPEGRSGICTACGGTGRS